MEIKYYTVIKIEGEYATIMEEETKDEIFISLFFLPQGTDIGTRLKYEMLQYEIV